ncbi:hypothetical protein ABW21_db0203741 [Orbilia brochopaga]|nr:hypothetical protein ABW21_db0203741 [Drechslerella brochopaga]
MATGKLGQKLVLDTNLLAPLLESKAINPWLARVMDDTQNEGVFHLSVYEHFGSSKVVEVADYEEIIGQIEKMGIEVLPGSYKSSRAMAMECQSLAERNQRSG